MRLLISDANLLIDLEAGALMETLFQLPMQFGIPDLLYYEEIEPGSPGLKKNPPEAGPYCTPEKIKRARYSMLACPWGPASRRRKPSRPL
jgi:hypothetical protein